MEKKKIWSSLSRIIIAIMFVASWAVLGVALALQSAKVEIGGGITFDATDVYAKITGTVTGNKTDVTLPEINFDASSEDYSSIQTQLDAWKSIDLVFPNARQKIEIAVTVENLSSEVPFWISFEDTININNVLVTRSTTDGTDLPKFSTIEVPAKTDSTTSSKTFTIGFEVEDKHVSVNGNWLLAFNLINEAPKEVATASELVSTMQSAISSQKSYTAIKLTQNLDLTSLNSQFLNNTSSYMLFSSFKGELDGNGKTITMNSEARGNYSSIFKNIEGYFHDFTLYFPNIDNKEINFANTTTGDTIFENITTTGSITITGGNNWSPYVNHYTGSITFKNCTNELSVVNENSYGSLFVGGYCLGAPEGKTASDAGIVPDAKATFINCKNTASVRMKNVGFLWGNSFHLPKLENITIQNCVNEGQIIGDMHAGLFVGMRNDEDEKAYMRPYFDFGDYALDGGTQEGLFQIVGDDLRNDNGGICKTLERKTILKFDESDNKFKFINVTAGHTYRISFIFNDTEFDSEGNKIAGYGVSVTKDFTATSTSTIDTGFYNYDFIFDYEYKALSNPTKTEVTDWNITASAHPYEAYIVEAGGKYYYYVDVTDIDNIKKLDSQTGYITISAFEYDENGDIVTFQNLGGWDEGEKKTN